MRGNIVYIALNKFGDEFEIQSFSIADMINLEKVYTSSGNLSWKLFYDKCCQFRVGSIVCNCNPNTLKREFVKHNVKFSDKKHVVNYFRFIGLDELQGMSVKFFIWLSSMATNRTMDKFYENINLASHMSSCARFWCEKKLVGVGILKDTLEVVCGSTTSVSGELRQKVVDYMSKACDKYNIPFNENMLIPAKGTRPKYNVAIWFKDFNNPIISKVYLLCVTCGTEIIIDLDNPDILKVRELFLNYTISEVITNIEEPRARTILRDYHISVYRIPITNWFHFAVSTVQDLYNFGLESFPFTTCTDVFYDMFTLEEFYSLYVNRDISKVCKFIDIYTYMYGLYELRGISAGLRNSTFRFNKYLYSLRKLNFLDEILDVNLYLSKFERAISDIKGVEILGELVIELHNKYKE